jgi:leucyl/phenylalanyl-tRNA--protein transferase
MFAEAPDASKVAFATLVRQLDRWGFDFVDCQVHTEHLERFGAYEVPRQAYLEMLAVALDEPTRRGKWEFDIDLDAFAETGGGGPAPEAEVPTRTKRASQG